MLHRDVKPSNLLVSRSGAVKVADFGISTAVASFSSVAEPLSWVGSTCYMSPERIRGHPYGASADIWGLGLTCAVFFLSVDRSLDLLPS